MSHLTGASPGALGFHEEFISPRLKEGLDGRCHPAYLTLREHEVVLILRSVVKMSGDVVSCLLSEFHWPKSGVTRNHPRHADFDCLRGV